MDEFLNPVPPALFRATNGPWNALRLNAPWSVGYVASLIESRPFAEKTGWRDFYYESGAERLRLLAALPEADRLLLTDFRLALTDPVRIRCLPAALKTLNFDFGRTRDELAEKARLLCQGMETSDTPLSLDQAVACVRFRVVGETWNGVVLRERATVATLQRLMPGLRFEKTPGDFDHRYAVDYQLFREGTLLGGIQIKPASYAASNAPYLVTARRANRAKNEAYQRDFGAPVFDVLASTNGELLNPAVLDRLRALASP